MPCRSQLLSQQITLHACVEQAATTYCALLAARAFKHFQLLAHPMITAVHSWSASEAALRNLSCRSKMLCHPCRHPDQPWAQRDQRQESWRGEMCWLSRKSECPASGTGPLTWHAHWPCSAVPCGHALSLHLLSPCRPSC